MVMATRFPIIEQNWYCRNCLLNEGLVSLTVYVKLTWIKLA